MKSLKYITPFIFLLLLGSINAQTEFVKPETQQIKVEVEGLTCPFCAYTLEKKLKTINGVEKLKIDFDEGTVFLTTDKEKDISDSKINLAIEQSGFTPKSIMRNIKNLREDEK